MSRCAKTAAFILVQVLVHCIVSALLFGCGHAQAQEVALFNLTGVEGYASMRYSDDRNATQQGGQNGGGHSAQGHSDWRNEIFLMTHSYVYHPNFLTLDIGGGPILQLGELLLDGSNIRSRGTLYNLVGRGTFLRGKPVSGSLFYEHLNPVMTITPGQILNQETTRYGMELSASAAAVPFPLRFEFTRSESNGSGDQRVMNDRQDHLNLRLTRSFGSQGATQVQYQASRQESLSGSVNLPIQSASSTSQGLDVDTRLQFGDGNKHELVNILSMNSRRYVVGTETMPAQTDLNVLLDVRLKNSEELTSFGTYHYSNNDNGERTAVTHGASSGLTWSPSNNWELSAGGRAEDSRSGQFSLQTFGLNGMVRYQQPLPVGELQASYGVRRDQRSQRSLGLESKVVGERIGLTGTTVSNLAMPHTVQGSVVVSNLARSQVYVENIDYALSTVGQTTRVQRLIGGNILDGEEVLVDYAYSLGGTFAYGQTDQTMNINWALSRQINIYMREYSSTTELLSGDPTFPLNNVHSHLYGMRADFPLQAGIAFALGGSMERERIAETISPLRRETDEVYLQTEEPIFDVGNIGISLRRMAIDYENSTLDTNLRGYGMRFTTRRFGADLSAVRNHECDSGGAVPRCRWNDAINAQWQERKLTMTARLTRARETQGTFERTHTLFQFTLRRDL